MKFRYFWDVHGSNKTEVKMPRLNLAGVEALNAGCIVLAEKRATPEWLKPVVILVDRKNPDVDEICEQAKYFNEDPRFMLKMHDVIASSPYGYNALKQKFEEIIKIME